MKAAKGAKGRDKRKKKKQLKQKDRRENDSGKESHPLSPDENFPVSLSAGFKGETPLSSSNNDIIPSPVYHKDTSVISFCSSDVTHPASSSTSEVILPASSSATDVILPASSSASDVILPASSSASDVILPVSSRASDVILPASSSASDVILPGSSSASDVILSASSSASDVILSASSSASDVILLASSSASDVILSASSSASDVILPAPSSASDVILPASSSASDVIIPASSGASEVILPAPSSASDVICPASSSASDVFLPAHTVDGVVSTVYSDKTVIQPDGIPSGRNILRAKRLSGRAAVSQNSQESFAISTAVHERAVIQITTGTGNITVTIPTSSERVVIPSTYGNGSVILSSSDDEIVIPLTSSAVDAIPSTSVAEVVFPLTSGGINVIASIYRKGAITRSTSGDVSVPPFTSDARAVISPSYGDGTVIPTSGSDATDAIHSSASNDVVADILSEPSNGDQTDDHICSGSSIAADAISKINFIQSLKEETVSGDEHSNPAYLGAASKPGDLPFTEHAVIAALLDKDDFIKSPCTALTPEIDKVTDCEDIGVVSQFSADRVIAKSMSHEEPMSAEKLRNIQPTAGEGFDCDRNRNFAMLTAHSMVSIQEDCLAAVCNNGGQDFCHGDTTPANESTAERSGDKLPANDNVRRGNGDTMANDDMESSWFTDWGMPSPGSDSTYIVFIHGGR